MHRAISTGEARRGYAEPLVLSVSEEEGMRMALSGTEAGVAWLDNFSTGDRTLATRLLDAFVLDSWTIARASLLELVRTEIGLAGSAGTVWVLPAMDSGDIRRAKTIGRFEPLTAFQNFEPGMDIPSMPGSEGLIGHLLRDIQGKGVLPPSAPISKLRQKRVRTIIVVSDTIETGGQVGKYIQALLRNPTLKSWRSFHWIKVVVVAYAVSRDGERAISDHVFVDSLRFVRHAPTIQSLPWTSQDIEAALRLCVDYGYGTDRLGYGDHGGLFGFQDRVPNTVPRIFRQRDGDWAPLFAGGGGRQVTSGMIRELASSSEMPVAHDEIVAAVRQERLSISIRKHQRESNRDVLAALALLRTSPQRVDILGIALNMTQVEVEGLMAYLRTQGWIDHTHNLTESGIAELAAGKRKPRRVEPRRTDVNPVPYYPESLR